MSGFASDCVETLEEIDIQGKKSFMENGGKNFDLIPCLNDSSDHINLFEKLSKNIFKNEHLPLVQILTSDSSCFMDGRTFVST